MKRIVWLFAVLILLSTMSTISPARAGDQQVLVFAAASTTNAVTDICDIFNQKGGAKAVASFASSSTLAKQIENGAPADVFISANIKWMDYLAEKKMIDPDTRVDLLANRIVLIVPASSDTGEVKIEPAFPLAERLGSGKLSMGDPDHVPAGIYARQALESLGLWEGVASKTARAKDVRAALALVERGECPYGVVYATDAAISDQVRVVGLFPESSHPPITYPVALIAGRDNPGAQAFLELLKSPEAKAVFEKYGFSVR